MTELETNFITDGFNHINENIGKLFTKIDEIPKIIDEKIAAHKTNCPGAEPPREKAGRGLNTISTILVCIVAVISIIMSVSTMVQNNNKNQEIKLREIINETIKITLTNK